MLNALAVFVGGGLGSLCRYALGLYLPSGSFPFGTFVANLLACFILGFLTGYLAKNTLSDPVKLLLGTGFCGGFSTFSTFSKESLLMGQDALTFTAVSYVILSLVFGILAVWAGIFLANLRA